MLRVKYVIQDFFNLEVFVDFISLIEILRGKVEFLKSYDNKQKKNQVQGL